MRILFDNGTPRKLRRQLFGHEIETAMERGWATLANGVLLDRAEEAGYEVLITTDQGIGYQQNMSNRRVAVVVLMNPRVPAYRGERKPSAMPLRKYAPVN
jgi:hypothetical protein